MTARRRDTVEQARALLVDLMVQKFPDPDAEYNQYMITTMLEQVQQINAMMGVAMAVLVAIAIPVFNGALTKSKEAADVANVRATYAEWQTAMLTENTKAPADKDAFLKGPDNGTAIVLNYGDDKLTYDAGTGIITYKATKLTDENGAKTFTWTLGTPDIH